MKWLDHSMGRTGASRCTQKQIKGNCRLAFVGDLCSRRSTRPIGQRCQAWEDVRPVKALASLLRG